ncbi:MAG: hypothetical protein L3J63_08045 [Geopsychrobacter sp.]|nr:hypothetical protein [Geopsychrobacter sp.]
MAKTKQVGLRLDEHDEAILKEIATKTKRTEQDILRDSLRMYAENFKEQMHFMQSVERGWFELQSGLGEVVTENDNFIESIKRDIHDEFPPS